MKGLGQNFENKLRKQGFVRICGIDEVGRGAWAGPLVAAGVIFDEGITIKGLTDSKKLSSERREELFDEIKEKASRFCIHEIDNTGIDRLGIGNANRLVVNRILEELAPDFALIDHIWMHHSPVPCEILPKGDGRVFSIAAASVLAKVHRDRLMDDFDRTYPGYNFADNKGYGTKEHQAALDKLEKCEIHRVSYQPVNQRKLI